MRVAVLGWGSLIWEPRTLPLAGDWIRNGPSLPLEFSRVSTSRRNALTLVIDPQHGARCPSRFAESTRFALDDAIEDLRIREGRTNATNIGYVNLDNGENRCNTDPTAIQGIVPWARANRFGAVIWTDLRSNFEDVTAQPFSVESALAYLRALTDEGARLAREYVNNAPDEIVTPLRRAVIELGWTPL